MTSKGNTECFVYITLPGQTEAVTAGRFQLTKDRRGNALRPLRLRQVVSLTRRCGLD
ncbi:hypothetical protein ABIB82_006400 [Bradyrhizobium sp. i1.8.4]